MKQLRRMRAGPSRYGALPPEHRRRLSHRRSRVFLGALDAEGQTDRDQCLEGFDTKRLIACWQWMGGRLMALDLTDAMIKYAQLPPGVHRTAPAQVRHLAQQAKPMKLDARRQLFRAIGDEGRRLLAAPAVTPTAVGESLGLLTTYPLDSAQRSTDRVPGRLCELGSTRRPSHCFWRRGATCTRAAARARDRSVPTLKKAEVAWYADSMVVDAVRQLGPLRPGR
jgi:hypothetical protein